MGKKRGTVSGIYKIQSRIKPERIYIGSAVASNHRWAQHLWLLRRNKHHSKKLQRHYNKYGEEDLTFILIAGCDKHDLVIMEQFYIDAYNPYFNGCPTAGSSLGFKHSEETLQKLRKLRPPGRSAKDWSLEQRKKRSELNIINGNRPPSRKGIKDTPEERAAKSIRAKGNQYCLGTKQSMLTRQKRSVAIKEWWRLKRLKESA